MQAPKNLIVSMYFSGSVEISWEGVLPSSDYTYTVSALDYNTGLWNEVAVTRITATVVSGPYSAVKVAVRNALDFSDISDYSETLPINIRNTSSIHDAYLAGIDDSGRHTFLATTPEGIVKVTGATVNNYGGDASAANQLTEISVSNTIATRLSDAVLALNQVLSKLNDVGMSAAVVAALKSVSVTNQPVNFPDSAALSELQDIKAGVAKDSSLSLANNLLTALLKPTDLSLDANKRLGVVVDNIPSNFPDSAVLSAVNALSGIAGDLLTALQVNTDIATETELHTESTSITAALIASRLAEALSLLSDIITAISDSNLILNSVDTYSEQIKDTLLLIKAMTDGMLQSNDFRYEATGALITHAENMPTDFPDSASLSALNQIKNYLQLLNQGTTAHITGALPTGANTIGAVNVNNAILPENAATEATLRSAGNVLLELYNALKTIPSILIPIKDALSAIAADTSMLRVNRVKLIEKEMSFANGPVELRVLDEVAPELLEINNWAVYDLVVFTYGVGVNAKLRAETSYMGQNFYHIISDAMINPSSIKAFEVTLPIQNISLKISEAIAGGTNAAGVRVIVYGRRK